MHLNIYLLYNGNCEAAMNFYKDVLGGDIKMMMRYSEAPMPTPEELKDKIMHAVMDVAGTQILFSDSGPATKVDFGNNFSVSITVDSDGELTRVFAAMSEGGIVKMPLKDTFWGARFGMCEDKFGVNWMFSYNKK